MMTPDADITTIAAITCAVVALIALLRARPALWNTTLLGAWFWALVSVAAVAGAELALVNQSSDSTLWNAPLRFAASALTVCPTIAVLGAKRPQHRAWHWIVLSLWIVVCIPAVNAALFDAGGPTELHAAQATFLWLLILLGLVNYLPTRYAVAALLIAAGQLFLFSSQLLLLRAEFAHHTTPIGIALCAIGLAFSPLSRRRPIKIEMLDEAWRDFRDDFGAFWAVRVLTRLNAAAETNGWPVRLHWSGFTPSAAERDAAAEKAIRRCLNSMLRRFL